MFVRLFKALIFVFGISVTFHAHSQITNYNPPLLPGGVAAGSLVIAMDDQNQPTLSPFGYVFNLKTYGLVNLLLKNQVAVKWIINVNKSSPSDSDISQIPAVKVFPDTSIGTYTFSSGPFVIDAADTYKAIPIIRSYGQGVCIYKITESMNFPVQFILKNPVKVALLTDGGNSAEHKTALTIAGFDTADYQEIPAVKLSSGSCFTFASESADRYKKLSDTAVTNSVLRFVKGGGSFFAQDTAVFRYEEKNHFVTNGTLAPATLSASDIKNAGHPFIQVNANPVNIASLYNSIRITGSFLPETYSVIQQSANAEVIYKALTRKYTPKPEGGGYVFYYSESYPSIYYYTWFGPGARNAVRMYLNAAMLSSQKAATCVMNDLRISLYYSSTNELCINDTLNISITVPSAGSSTSSALPRVQYTVTGLDFVKRSVSAGGSLDTLQNIWSLNALSDTLFLTYKATQSGTANLSAYLLNNYDPNPANDTSRPSITINPLPAFSLETLAGNKQQICQGDTFRLQLDSLMTYSWSTSSPVFSGTGSLVQFAPPSSATLYATATDNHGCRRSDSLIINVSQRPSAAAITSQDIYTYRSQATVAAKQPVVGAGIWSVISGSGKIDNPASISIRVTDLSMGRNVLRWKVNNGNCSSSQEDILIFVKDIGIPNGFSPNSDGFNDTFSVEGIDELQPSKLEILTRWGTMVYSSDHYTNTWNGTNDQGEKLPDDTYYYTLTTSEGKIYKSYVVLKR